MTTQNDPDELARQPASAAREISEESSGLTRSETSMTVIAVGVIGSAFYFLQAVLIPLFVAFFLSYLGIPVQRSLERIRCPRGLAITLVIISFGLGLTGLGYFFYSSTDTLVAESDRYGPQLVGLVSEVEEVFERFSGPSDARNATELADEMPEKAEDAADDGEDPASESGSGEPSGEKDPPGAEESGGEEGGGGAAGSASPSGEESAPSAPPSEAEDPKTGASGGSDEGEEDGGKGFMERVGEAFTDEPEEPRRSPLQKQISSYFSGETMLSLFGSVLGGLGDLFLVLIFLVFILVDRGFGTLDRRIVLAFSKRGTDSARPILNAIHQEIETYIVTKTLLSLGTGIAAWITMTAFGLPFAPLFAIFVFLFNYVPNVGSIAATILPALFALLHFQDDPWRVIGLVTVLSAIQLTVGNVIEPWLMGKRLRLNPITVLLALVIWGFLWGIWGMVLSVPLMATIRIILEKSRALPAVATMMSSD